MQKRDIHQIEIDLVLDAMYRRHGYDFRDYARSSLERRLRQQQLDFKLDNLSEMLPRILHDNSFSERFLKIMSVTVTDLFRDPVFFRTLREKIIPILKTYPYFKIWHAGCATGEEVYSMAILLNEEGLSDKCQLYATDYNNQSLHVARKGIYPAERFDKYKKNYQQAGGKQDLSAYIHSKYDGIIMRNDIKENIMFSEHNLVSDGVFGEMNLILCRNVMIYFNPALKENVIQKFHDSLCHRGYLCLGSKESLLADWDNDFETISDKQKIYRKLK